ncbi:MULTISPECIES: MspA family porin [Mycobacterium]|uniref:MspA family porin n=1 Tax=Mycobacterium TaxID=1763 RepID=UPI001CD98C65|nr:MULTISPECIES: MspA family porin [Mycobacterium]MCA2240832.1 MspA family porin [Mycobacterium sp. WUMAC-067]MCA2313196.1 MspA family porin [Mycobacterium sp. WUMAC-025]MEE3750496.1 MspA family porin [Mycobacterium intracellulare]
MAIAVCLAISVIAAPAADSEPQLGPAPPDAAAPGGGVVPSNPPAILNTPDGWTLGVGARDEMQVPVAPLTTAISSREYVSGGIFVGSLRGGSEEPHGVLEVGYQIGCGIDMSTSNGVIMEGGAGIIPGVTPTFDTTGTLPALLPFVSTPINGAMSVGLKPGLVIVVPVIKKQFRGANPWVMISNFHVKIDGCVGQSFIRSYAVLTRQTDLSDVVLSYVGVTKAV